MEKFRFSSLSFVIAACVAAHNVSAGDVKMYNSAPSAEEMGRLLFGDDGSSGEPEMKTRSISFSKKKPSPSMEEAQPKSISKPVEETASASEPKALGLPIKFASNSATILDDSLPFLNEIGKMLSMDDNRKILIEGHTDAAGSEDYNLMLSYRRAKSVRAYLVDNYNISESRLKVSGKGEMSPLEGTNPRDGINRRVQFYKAQ